MRHTVSDQYTHTHPSGDVGAFLACSCGWSTDVIAPSRGYSREESAYRSYRNHVANPYIHEHLPRAGSHSHNVTDLRNRRAE